jgi:surface antigen
LIGALIFVVNSSHAAGLNPFGATGLPLNQQDYADMKAAGDPLRNDESLPIGTMRAWSNPASGNRGTVTLLERFQYNYQGNKLPCRKLKYHIVLRSHSDPYNLALDFCRIAVGSWKIM